MSAPHPGGARADRIGAGGAIEVQVRRWAVFGQLSDDALAPALRATAAALLPLARSRRPAR